MKEITIKLSDAEYKAFEYVAYSPEDWIQNLATDRANRAKIEVSGVYFADKNSKGEAITAVGVDAQVIAAFADGVVTTAKAREDALQAGN